jgi:hypothetical protein
MPELNTTDYDEHVTNLAREVIKAISGKKGSERFDAYSKALMQAIISSWANDAEHAVEVLKLSKFPCAGIAYKSGPTAEDIAGDPTIAFPFTTFAKEAIMSDISLKIEELCAKKILSIIMGYKE